MKKLSDDTCAKCGQLAREVPWVYSHADACEYYEFRNKLAKINGLESIERHISLNPSLGRTAADFMIFFDIEGIRYKAFKFSGTLSHGHDIFVDEVIARAIDAYYAMGGFGGMSLEEYVSKCKPE